MQRNREMKEMWMMLASVSKVTGATLNGGSSLEFVAQVCSILVVDGDVLLFALTHKLFELCDHFGGDLVPEKRPGVYFGSSTFCNALLTQIGKCLCQVAAIRSCACVVLLRRVVSRVDNVVVLRRRHCKDLLRLLSLGW